MSKWFRTNRWIRILPYMAILSLVIFFITIPHRNKILSTSEQVPPQSDNALPLEQVKKAGVDLPLFFFSILPYSLPDTLSHLAYSPVYANTKLICLHFGYPNKALDFRDSLQHLYAHLLPKASRSEAVSRALQYVQLALHRTRTSDIHRDLRQIVEGLGDAGLPPSIEEKGIQLLSKWEKGSGVHWQNFLPTIRWHGYQNQYFKWLGNFATPLVSPASYPFPSRVNQKIGRALQWTLLLNGVSLLIILLVAVPFGLFLGATRHQRVQRSITGGLFAIYSIPDFWLATMLIAVFTTTAYCTYCDLLPVPGMLYAGDNGILATFFHNTSYFILPFIVTTTDAIAYLTNQIQSTTQSQFSQTYTLAAKAKGLSDRAILLRHVAPNALFPLIVLIADILPGIVTGSLVVEVLFNIPGMGRLLYESLLTGEMDIVRSILLLTGCLTFIGYALTDWGMSKVNPTIKLARH